MYFLAGSIINCLFLYIVVLWPYLGTNLGADTGSGNIGLCLFRLLLTYPLYCLVLWFIVLSSLDRFLTSSHNARIRRLSSAPIARIIIVSIIAFFFLIYVHVAVFFKINPSGSATVCSITSSDYIIFFNIFFVLTTTLLPILFMSIFGALVIRNVRKMHNRVVPQADDARNERIRSSDRQLLRMLLFQVMITTIISVPYCVIGMYSTFALTLLKITLSTSGRAIFNFISNLLLKIYYANAVTGFYIYTLTGPKFRTEFKQCNQYALKIVLTTTGLMQCLPLRAQQALRGENQRAANNETMTVVRGRNTVHPVPQQQTMEMKVVRGGNTAQPIEQQQAMEMKVIRGGNTAQPIEQQEPVVVTTAV
jgi:hypothetical protein